MNFAEAMWRQNQYIESPQLPSGLGYEVSGVVEKLGPGITTVKIGDNVATFPGHNQGDYPAYGELAVMPVSSVARYPAKLSDVEAASYWTAYLTGYFGVVRDRKACCPSDRPDYRGFVVYRLCRDPMAKAIGARVIATTRTSKKAAALREAGADVVIATEEEVLVQRVLSETAGKGVDVAYDAVGGKQLATLGQVVKQRGHLILYGIRGGDDMAAPLWDLWVKSIQFHLYTVFNFTGSLSLGLTRDDGAVQRGITFINGGIETGLFKPKVDRTFKLDDVVAAHRYMEAGTQIGKIVITV